MSNFFELLQTKLYLLEIYTKKMKIYRIILVLLVLFSSCKSNKITFGTVVKAKKISTKKIVKRHTVAKLKSKTVDAKLRIAYSDKKNNHTFSVRLKIKKDEVIWLKGTKFITVFKAKITPTEVSYYSPLDKTYFTGDFYMLERLLGVKMTFTQLQNILLGQAIYDIKGKKYSSTIDENSHLLSPKRQEELFEAFFWVNPQHYKLDRQSLKNKDDDKSLYIFYRNYSKIDEVTFPKKIEIKAKYAQKFTNIYLDYKSVQFNTILNLSYKIPTGYKQITFR